jgi:type IX secretion system PorP/SprF family membrane protein
MTKYYIPLFLPVLIMFLFHGEAYGQQDAHIALYKYHLQIINPAFIGTQGSTYLNTSYRSQWAGIEDAPRIQAISLGIPSTEKRLNYGALFYNDKTFIEKQTRFFANFSYRIPLKQDLNLFLGLSAGGENFSVNFESLKNVSPLGDQFLTSFSRFNPNMGVGVYLQGSNFYAALSTPKLFQTKRFREADGFSTTARDLVHLYGSLGGRIPLSADWFWVNSANFRYVVRAPWSVITNTGIGFKNHELTVGYQWDASFSGTLMIQASDALSFGYSYQFPSSKAIASLTTGNHELLLKIRLGKSNVETEAPEETDQETDTTTPSSNQ